MSGQNAVAISKAQAALRAGPKPAQAVHAWELIACCSCNLRQSNAALAAASHLDNSRREMVKLVCARKGVPIE